MLTRSSHNCTEQHQQPGSMWNRATNEDENMQTETQDEILDAIIDTVRELGHNLGLANAIGLDDEDFSEEQVEEVLRILEGRNQTCKQQLRRVDEWALWNEETEEVIHVELTGNLIEIPEQFVDCIAAGEPTDEALEWLWSTEAGNLKPLIGTIMASETDYSRWENENGEELWMEV